MTIAAGSASWHRAWCISNGLLSKHSCGHKSTASVYEILSTMLLRRFQLMHVREAYFLLKAKSIPARLPLRVSVLQAQSRHERQQLRPAACHTKQHEFQCFNTQHSQRNTRNTTHRCLCTPCPLVIPYICHRSELRTHAHAHCSPCVARCALCAALWRAAHCSCVASGCQSELLVFMLRFCL